MARVLDPEEFVRVVALKPTAIGRVVQLIDRIDVVVYIVADGRHEQILLHPSWGGHDHNRVRPLGRIHLGAAGQHGRRERQHGPHVFSSDQHPVGRRQNHKAVEGVAEFGQRFRRCGVVPFDRRPRLVR